MRKYTRKQEKINSLIISGIAVAFIILGVFMFANAEDAGTDYGSIAPAAGSASPAMPR